MIVVKPVRPLSRRRRKPRTPNPEVPRRFLDATASLIEEHDFPALRIEEIAERAGLSVGTFYLYFDSKADLFIQLVIEYTERLGNRLREAYASTRTVQERLATALDGYLNFVQEHERGFLYFRDYSAETSVGRLSTWAIDRHAEDLQPLFEDVMERGEMPRSDARLAAQALIAVTQHMAGFWLEHKDEYSREEVQAFLSRSIFNA